MLATGDGVVPDGGEILAERDQVVVEGNEDIPHCEPDLARRSSASPLVGADPQVHAATEVLVIEEIEMHDRPFCRWTTPLGKLGNHPEPQRSEHCNILCLKMQ